MRYKKSRVKDKVEVSKQTIAQFKLIMLTGSIVVCHSVIQWTKAHSLYLYYIQIASRRPRICCRVILLGILSER